MERLALLLVPLLAQEMAASNRQLVLLLQEIQRQQQELVLSQSQLPLLLELQQETLNSLQPPAEEQLSRLLGQSVPQSWHRSSVS